MTRTLVPRQPVTQTTRVEASRCWSPEATSGLQSRRTFVRCASAEKDLKRVGRGWLTSDTQSKSLLMRPGARWPQCGRTSPHSLPALVLDHRHSSPWRGVGTVCQRSAMPPMPPDVVNGLSAGVSVRLSCPDRVRRPAGVTLVWASQHDLDDLLHVGWQPGHVGEDFPGFGIVEVLLNDTADRNELFVRGSSGSALC